MMEKIRKIVETAAWAACAAVALAGPAHAICPVQTAQYKGGLFGTDAVTATACFVFTESGGAGVTTAAVPLNNSLSAGADLPTHVLTTYSAGLFASAAEWDTLTFAGLPATGGSVTLSLALTGTVSGGANASASLQEGTPAAGFLAAASTQSAGFVSGVPLPPAVTLTFTAFDATPVTVLAQLTAGGAGGVADLADPPRLDIVVPLDVSVTSASGFFDTAARVPEPSSLALLLGGAGASLARRRRGR